MTLESARGESRSLTRRRTAAGRPHSPGAGVGTRKRRGFKIPSTCSADSGAARIIRVNKTAIVLLTMVFSFGGRIPVPRRACGDLLQGSVGCRIVASEIRLQ